MKKLTFDKNRKRTKYCPCNKKNTDGKFVPYVGYDNKGYCFSCDKTFLPNLDRDNYIKPEFNYKPPPSISYHNPNLIIQTGRNFEENNFIQFLKTIFPENEIKDVIKKYLIGTSKKWKGATIFWQIDNHQNIRNGKIMLYNSNNGKRIKNNAKTYITNVKSVLQLKDFNLKQCLFGLHLINETKNTTIGVVESEKTAILMSLFKPQYTWVATGSKSGFKYEMLKPLKSFSLIAFPDKSEYNDWYERALELSAFGFKIKVSRWVENIDVPNGTDLADIYIDSLLNLKETKKQTVRSNTDLIVEKMAIKNPAIIKLINIFDLADSNGNPIKVN